MTLAHAWQLADPDHLRARGPRGGPARRGRRRRRRRLVVGGPAHRGRPVGDRPPLGRRHRRPTSCRPRGTPAPAVHEYGGGAWTVSGGTLWFTEFADQRLYRLDPGSDARWRSRPSRRSPSGVRHADLRVVPDGDGVLAVRETHTDRARPPRSSTRSCASPTTAAGGRSSPGPDFVSDPRLAPGRRHAVAGCSGTTRTCRGTPPSSSSAPPTAPSTCIAGGAGRVGRPADVGRRPARCGSSATAPTSGRCTAERPHERGRARRRRRRRHRRAAVGVRPEPVRPARRRPGASFAYGRDGADRLAVARARRRACASSTCRYDVVPATCTRAGRRGRRASPASPASEPRGPAGRRRRRAAPRCSRPARDLGLDPAWFSRPEHVDLPDRAARHRHRRGARAGLPADQPGGRARPDGELPAAAGGRPRRPHLGGPLRCSSLRSSTGPRAASASPTSTTAAPPATAARYRDALQGRWGIADLDDVVACARYLADAGRVDPARLAIRGGSAGGYTTLAALTMRPGVFTAGASHYGVADLGALAAETHKFESPLPRRAGRAVAGRRATSTPSAHRSTTSTPSTPRWRSSRATRTRSCRPTRPR